MDQNKRGAVEVTLAAAGVRFAYLFGSRAAGTEGEGSDADIAAMPARELSLLAERMRTLAGLRNRLVHVYADADDAIVHASLPEGLTDLDAFSRAAARLVTGEHPQ